MSSRAKFRHRVDVNQKEIVDALRKIPGVTVKPINCDSIDIIVGYRNKNFLFEIKRDGKAKLKPSQQKFFAEWKGQICRVESLQEILNLLELIRIAGAWQHQPSNRIVPSVWG